MDRCLLGKDETFPAALPLGNSPSSKTKAFVQTSPLFQDNSADRLWAGLVLELYKLCLDGEGVSHHVLGRSWSNSSIHTSHTRELPTACPARWDLASCDRETLSQSDRSKSCRTRGTSSPQPQFPPTSTIGTIQSTMPSPLPQILPKRDTEPSCTQSRREPHGGLLHCCSPSCRAMGTSSAAELMTPSSALPLSVPEER